MGRTVSYLQVFMAPLMVLLPFLASPMCFLLQFLFQRTTPDNVVVSLDGRILSRNSDIPFGKCDPPCLFLHDRAAVLVVRVWCAGSPSDWCLPRAATVGDLARAMAKHYVCPFVVVTTEWTQNVPADSLRVSRRQDCRTESVTLRADVLLGAVLSTPGECGDVSVALQVNAPEVSAHLPLDACTIDKLPDELLALVLLDPLRHALSSAASHCALSAVCHRWRTIATTRRTELLTPMRNRHLAKIRGSELLSDDGISTSATTVAYDEWADGEAAPEDYNLTNGCLKAILERLPHLVTLDVRGRSFLPPCILQVLARSCPDLRELHLQDLPNVLHADLSPLWSRLALLSLANSRDFAAVAPLMRHVRALIIQGGYGNSSTWLRAIMDMPEPPPLEHLAIHCSSTEASLLGRLLLARSANISVLITNDWAHLDEVPALLGSARFPCLRRLRLVGDDRRGIMKAALLPRCPALECLDVPDVTAEDVAALTTAHLISAR